MKKLLVAVLAILSLVFIGLLALILLDKDQPVQPVKQEIVWRELDPKKIFEEVNKVRADAGVPLLQESPELYTSAKNKCDDMVQYNAYAHTNWSTGKRGVSYIQEVFPRSVIQGENLANAHYEDEKAVVDDWYASTDGHKEAMLSLRFSAGNVSTCHIPANEDHITAVVLHLAGF